MRGFNPFVWHWAPPPPVDLVQCDTCKRTFLPKVLKKHTNFCHMSKAKKKYVFDSRSHRTRGTEFSVLEPTQPKAEPPKKPSNWRKNREDLISSFRAAKIFRRSLPPLPPHPYDPDYIQCPYCQRRFKESAADRHIQICKEQHARMPNNGTAPLPLDLVQCQICIRRFFPEDREKHKEICQKLLAKRRKVFDSRRQRTGGTEIFFQKPTQPKPSIWREKYEDFMASRAHHQERHTSPKK
uniref:Zinc finger C2HC domain-containing protein 1A n=1 Tax=Gouania willdenowi TaxID=441366 RepID=A0A8C5N5V2_GOUWI